MTHHEAEIAELERQVVYYIEAIRRSKRKRLGLISSYYTRQLKAVRKRQAELIRQENKEHAA